MLDNLLPQPLHLPQLITLTHLVIHPEMHQVMHRLIPVLIDYYKLLLLLK